MPETRSSTRSGQAALVENDEGMQTRSSTRSTRSGGAQAKQARTSKASTTAESKAKPKPKAKRRSVRDPPADQQQASKSAPVSGNLPGAPVPATTQADNPPSAHNLLPSAEHTESPSVNTRHEPAVQASLDKDEHRIPQTPAGRPCPRRVYGGKVSTSNSDDPFISNRAGLRLTDRLPVLKNTELTPARNITLHPSVDSSGIELDAPEHNFSPSFTPPSIDHAHMRSPLPSPVESDPSGSDFEETAHAAEKEWLRKASFRKDMTPTIEQQDAEDEVDFQEEISSKRASRVNGQAQSRPRHRRDMTPQIGQQGAGDEPDSEEERSPRRSSHVNGKFQAKSSCRSRHAMGDDIENENSSHQSGPLRGAAKERLFAAQREYRAVIEAIAAEEGKPTDLLYEILGEDIKVPRRPNTWNIFQSWYGEHSETKRDSDMTNAEWTQFVREEYTAHLDMLGDDREDPEAREKHFKPMMDWYQGKMEDYVFTKKRAAKFNSVMNNVLDPIIKMGRKVYEQYRIHIFGFAIDTSRDSKGCTSSLAWGSSPMYMDLRQKYQATVSKQLDDYEGMFKGLEMLKSDREASHDVFAVNLRLIDGEVERDRNRRLLGEFLRSDLARVIEGSLDHGEIGKLQMSWARWPDTAFRYQVRLVGWPKDIGKVPGPGFKPKQDLKPKVLQEMVERRIQAIDNPMISGLCYIKPWTEEEKDLDSAKQSRVALVISDANETLMTLMDSKSFKQSVGQRRKADKRPRSPETQPRSGIDSGVESLDETPRPHHDRTSQSRHFSQANRIHGTNETRRPVSRQIPQYHESLPSESEAPPPPRSNNVRPPSQVYRDMLAADQARPGANNHRALIDRDHERPRQYLLSPRHDQRVPPRVVVPQWQPQPPRASTGDSQRSTHDFLDRHNEHLQHPRDSHRLNRHERHKVNKRRVPFQDDHAHGKSREPNSYGDSQRTRYESRETDMGRIDRPAKKRKIHEVDDRAMHPIAPLPRRGGVQTNAVAGPSRSAPSRGLGSHAVQGYDQWEDTAAQFGVEDDYIYNDDYDMYNDDY